MSKDEPTPGEWSAIREHMYGLPDAWRIVSALGVTVALIEPTAPTMSASEVEANARLFAASKELLAELEFAYAYLSKEPGCVAWKEGLSRMARVIAKAKGES